LSFGLAGALAEVVDNVWEHSASDLPGLGAFHLQSRRATFVVADLGIGVLNSLRSNPRYRNLQTSKEALENAVKPGVSRLDEAGRGSGFGTVLRGLAELWGVLRLRSG